MKVKDFDVSSAERAWQAFQRTIGVAAIHTPKEYERAVALANRLLDVVGEDESHPLAGLLDLVGELVAAYEAREQALPDAAPGEVLRLLMEQNALTQTDLRQELGGQRSAQRQAHHQRASGEGLGSAIQGVPCGFSLRATKPGKDRGRALFVHLADDFHQHGGR